MFQSLPSDFPFPTQASPSLCNKLRYDSFDQWLEDPTPELC